MIKFDVVVHDTTNPPEGRQRTRRVRLVEDVTATKARRIAIRAMRRGYKIYGGVMQTHNWGAMGGNPARTGFRTATITPAKLS